MSRSSGTCTSDPAGRLPGRSETACPSAWRRRPRQSPHSRRRAPGPVRRRAQGPAPMPGQPPPTSGTSHPAACVGGARGLLRVLHSGSHARPGGRRGAWARRRCASASKQQRRVRGAAHLAARQQQQDLERQGCSSEPPRRHGLSGGGASRLRTDLPLSSSCCGRTRKAANRTVGGCPGIPCKGGQVQLPFRPGSCVMPHFGKLLPFFLACCMPKPITRPAYGRSLMFTAPGGGLAGTAYEEALPPVVKLHSRPGGGHRRPLCISLFLSCALDRFHTRRV